MPSQPPTGWTLFDLPNARVRLRPDFLHPEEAGALLHTLTAQIPWQQDRVRLFGKTMDVPRLHQWFGEPAHTYRWSGLAMAPHPFPPALATLRDRVAEAAGSPFNVVLANLYRSGLDAVSWHADDEVVLGPDPTIASVSLGAERPFVLRHNTDPAYRRVEIPLPHGSLLVMSHGSQTHWQHALPRRKRVAGARLNLTFRHYVG